MERFGTFLVWSCYVAAGLSAVSPFIVMVMDWNDPGHMNRLIIALPAALILATLGKMLACLLVITDPQRHDKTSEGDR